MTIEYATIEERIWRPLPWQTAGLTYTATGYGARIPTQYVVRLAGDTRFRRMYATVYSNAASCWVTKDGRRLYLRDY